MDKYKLIKDFAVKSGSRALESQGNIISETKGDGVDLVTEVDRSIEKEFYKLVSDNFPDYGFFGEEFAELRNEKEYIWCIDPIDGTKYYANGLPLWSVAISLLRNKSPVYSVIYSPTNNQLYEAVVGGGAFLNDKEITIDRTTDISKLTFSWEAPTLNELHEKSRDAILEGFSELTKKTYRLRNLGSAALSLAWVAQGFFGGYVKYFTTEKQKMDNYAGILVLKEAGAEIYEAKIDDYLILIGGHESVVKQIREILKV